ncbi:hypothetical protein [Oxynema sp. CENA135]|nr:hypothetical protein [Oxynema sp. CENA135]
MVTPALGFPPGNRSTWRSRECRGFERDRSRSAALWGYPFLPS